MKYGALTSEAVQSLSDCAFRCGASSLSQASKTLRLEILERLLRRPQLMENLPHLRRLKRKQGFIDRLDRSLQQGRLCFESEEEYQVFRGRLKERHESSSLQNEVHQFGMVFDDYIKALGFVDEPLSFREAIKALSQSQSSLENLPKHLVLLRAGELENLERSFVDSLKRHTRIVELDLLNEDHLKLNEKMAAKQGIWHSEDDAIFELVRAIQTRGHHSKECVLIEDHPKLRRSLRLAFELQGVPVIETRDPLQVRLSESVKNDLLVLKLVGLGFGRDDVVEWIIKNKVRFSNEQIARWLKEISYRGIRKGLKSYFGGKLSDCYEALNELQETYGGRKSLESLRQALGSISKETDQLLDQIEVDFRSLGEESREAPCLYWLKRINDRILKAKPQVAKIKNATGVEIHLLNQVCFNETESKDRIWVLGLNERSFGNNEVGDYYFSAKDRDSIGDEFGLLNFFKNKELKVKKVKRWLRGAQEVIFVNAKVDYLGKECEILSHATNLLGLQSTAMETEEACHFLVSSYQAPLALPPQALSLVPFSRLGKNTMEATELDRVSRCSFQALAMYRWELKDEREPELDLWPDVRGSLIHRCIELILRHPQAERSSVELNPLIQQAWEELKPRGLLQGKHTQSYLHRNLRAVLEAFVKDNQAYEKRSQTEIFSLEKDIRLEMQVGGVKIRGIADRIDQHPEGLFVIDYKTSSDLPSGQEMVDSGYRLQLAFYALALTQQLAKRCLGVQFVSLGRKVSRSRGVLFKKWNGKGTGCLTHTRAKVSIFSQDPEVVWSQLHEHIESEVRPYLEGSYAPQPKKDSECARCRMIDICGRRRRLMNQSAFEFIW